MPILPSSSGSSVSGEDQRPASVSTQDSRTPATTFDEISGVGSTSSLPQNTGSPTKSAAATKADRVSIHGFGSGGVSERARNKGRGRVSIVVGTLYMCAGQWVEAIRELTEGATRARTLSDHLWHAKALENIMVCMLLFAWARLDFNIPQVCYPTNTKKGPVYNSPSTSALVTTNRAASDTLASGRAVPNSFAVENGGSDTLAPPAFSQLDLASAVADPLIVFDRNAIVVHANPAALSAFDPISPGTLLQVRFRALELQSLIEQTLRGASGPPRG